MVEECIPARWKKAELRGAPLWMLFLPDSLTPEKIFDILKSLQLAIWLRDVGSDACDDVGLVSVSSVAKACVLRIIPKAQAGLKSRTKSAYDISPLILPFISFTLHLELLIPHPKVVFTS